MGPAVAPGFRWGFRRRQGQYRGQDVALDRFAIPDGINVVPNYADVVDWLRSGSRGLGTLEGFAWDLVPLPLHTLEMRQCHATCLPMSFLGHLVLTSVE